MNGNETVKLCRMVAALCPAQTLGEYTPDAWAIVLDDIDYTDARQAVGNLARLPLEPGRSRYIEPGHIRHEVARIRRARLENTRLPDPPTGLSSGEYLAWLRDQVELIASGRYTPPALPPAAPDTRVHAAVTELATAWTAPTESSVGER